jgi:hypothetical protein
MGFAHFVCALQLAEGFTCVECCSAYAACIMPVVRLQALSTLDAGTFQAELGRFFPVLTRLMSCEYATADVQRALSELFLVRVGPMLPVLAQHQL